MVKKKEKERDIYTCISCGITDPIVEAGGIYYCPNPFCTASGSTNWKRNNLKVKEDRAGITILSYDGWLERGMEVVNTMPYALGVKIMATKKSQQIIRNLKHKKGSRT